MKHKNRPIEQRTMHLSISLCSSASFALPEEVDIDLSFVACFSVSFLDLIKLSSSFRSSARFFSMAADCSVHAVRICKSIKNDRTISTDNERTYLLHTLPLAHETQPPASGLGRRSTDLLFLKLRDLLPLYKLLLEIMLEVDISFSFTIVLGNAHHSCGKCLLAL